MEMLQILVHEGGKRGWMTTCDGLELQLLVFRVDMIQKFEQQNRCLHINH